MAIKNVVAKTWDSSKNFDNTLDSRYPTGNKPPAAPAISAAQTGTTGINIGLVTPSAGAAFYVVERSLDGISGWVAVISNWNGAAPYLLTGLNPNTRYYFRGYAVANAIYSTASSIVNAKTDALNIPVAPTVIWDGTISPVSVGVTLSGGSNITTLTPRRSLAGANTWTNYPAIAANSTSFTFSSLTPQTNYDLQFVAFNTDGTDFSAIITKLTPAIDSVVDAFDFDDISNASVSTLYVSNQIQPTGANSPVSYSVTGGEVSKNGGAFGTASGTYNPGDRFTVRGTSSAFFNTPKDVTLTIGSVSGIFTITTAVSVGAPAYSPLKLLSFDSGTTGQLASGATGFDHPQSGVAGQPFYSTAIAGPFGGGKVARMAWSAANQGFFGGDMFRGAQIINDGDKVWIRQYVYLVPGFSWGFGSNPDGDGWGGTKWLRQFFGTVFDPPGDDNCFQMHNTGGGKVWGMTREGYAGNQNMQFNLANVPDVPQGEWVSEEYHIDFNANPALGKIRYWQKDVFIAEVIGQTKPAGTQTMNRIVHGDYWNGLSPQAQTWYLDEVIITVQTPDAVDAGGRPFIGMARRVSDFA